MNASTAVVGALRGVLVLDTSDWTPAVNRARGDLTGLRGTFDQLGRTMDDLSSKARNLGAGLTAGLTLPLGALAATSNKTASGFEAAMKRVEAALQGVTGKELKQLSDQARELAPRVGKGATEAADGIEALGLAGLSTADILGGALKASLDLAAAGATDLTPAASLVTDVMGQFKVGAAQLPAVVNNVVGALDASKFGFVDFQEALAQGGGVAASAGVSFSDFASAIAATSTQFSSGSDAGTSFKTYIQSLVPISKEAEFAMKKLGIEFFDVSTGRMKPLAEQAEILRKALGGLSDKSKTDALKTIFGSDAARTAIGLMEKGRQGIVDLQQQIAGGDVGSKIDKRLEGEAAATTRVSNAFESLKIAIGQAGLTALMTDVKNSFARFLESLAGANPALLKVGVAIGAVSAAIGPLALAFGALASFILARLARSFGAIGWAISAIIEPIGTLGAALIQLVARVGIKEGLLIISRAFLGFAGPVGIAISALLLFKDSVVPALQQVWKVASETLGPPLAALFAQIGQVVSGITAGPIGSGFAALMSLFGAVMDVAGTFVGAMVEMFGVAIVQALQLAIRALSGIVSVVGDVVGVVSALLSGDFAGAWGAAGDAVDAACQTIVDLVTMLFPQLTVPIKVAYEAAKAYLVDGFTFIAAAFTSVVAGAVNWVASAFPNVVAAAKGVYDGVKGWLVDKFGGLMTWIGNAAKWIGDKYSALKERLGLGAAANDNSPAAPPAPKPVVAPPATGGTKVVDFTPPKKTRTKKGRDTTYDGANREQLATQVELDAARARGDKEAEQAIQDRLALSKQVEAYQRTGLSLDQARINAARDMKVLAAARAEAAAKEIADEQMAVAIDVARLTRDQATELSLERQVELKRRIASYYEQTKNLAEATRLAEADQAKVDAARDQVRKQWFADDAQDRAVRLGQVRGDTDEEVRQAQRVVDIRERARKLEEQGMSSGAAVAQATTEWDQEDKARMTGNIRQTFKDGFRAALDGDVGSFFQSFWKDRVAKGMEDALNSLADLIASLFSKAGAGSSSSGGLFGSIASALGGLLGGHSGFKVADTITAPTSMPFVADTSGLPAFATGGSFKVGGMSGIDRNMVSFRATKGEIVDIRKPGNDVGGGRFIIEPSPWFDVRAAGAAEPSIQSMGTRAAAGGAQLAGATAAKRQRRSLVNR